MLLLALPCCPGPASPNPPPPPHTHTALLRGVAGSSKHGINTATCRGNGCSSSNAAQSAELFSRAGERTFNSLPYTCRQPPHAPALCLLWYPRRGTTPMQCAPATAALLSIGRALIAPAAAAAAHAPPYGITRLYNSKVAAAAANRRAAAPRPAQPAGGAGHNGPVTLGRSIGEDPSLAGFFRTRWSALALLGAGASALLFYRCARRRSGPPSRSPPQPPALGAVCGSYHPDSAGAPPLA